MSITYLYADNLASTFLPRPLHHQPLRIAHHESPCRAGSIAGLILLANSAEAAGWQKAARLRHSN